MENNLSNVSVIIPSRNEEKFIGKCLDSVLRQDYPKNKMEIIVVDGESEDGTKEIVKNYFQKFSFVRLINNPEKFTPFAFNAGIKNAKGEIVVIMGAHAVYKEDYLSKCVKYLKQYDADNVGGILKTIPREDSLVSKLIVCVLSSYFGSGNSYFRIGSDKPKIVDTVFGGCYRKDVFNDIGLFNEKLIRNQDLELNLRLKRKGGKIMLFPDIVSYYYPKANLLDFAKHNFSDGFSIVYPLKFGIKAFSWRHLLPFAFVMSLFITAIIGIFFSLLKPLFFVVVGAYFFVSTLFSAKISIENKKPLYIFFLPLVFFIRHVWYGLGSFWGLLKIFKK